MHQCRTGFLRCGQESQEAADGGCEAGAQTGCDGTEWGGPAGFGGVRAEESEAGEDEEGEGACEVRYSVNGGPPVMSMFAWPSLPGVFFEHLLFP